MPKITRKEYQELYLLITYAYNKSREFQEAVQKVWKWLLPRMGKGTVGDLGLPPAAVRAVDWLLEAADVPDAPRPQLDDMLGPKS